MKSSYRDWYSYVYDRLPSEQSISDGGHDMFDDGNKVCTGKTRRLFGAEMH